MIKGCHLVTKDTTPVKAAFPVIDAHNHLWANWGSINKVVDAMDAVGVVAYCDLTSNVAIAWADGGYTIGQGDIEEFYRNVAPYARRFYGFTTATFAQPADKPLYTDVDSFVEKTIVLLRQHVQRGARGLKILKELGLRYRDGNGDLVKVDDPKLAPIWDECGKLGVPVLIHQSDPVGFFEENTPENEHHDSLLKYPTWSFSDSKFPRKQELLDRRNKLLRQHRNTTFMLPHVANFPEDLGSVATLLDENPNVYIDFSARIDELGRQPYTAREFIIRYQDRIYFGSDMPASVEMYRCYFRFLETYDEYFFPPDYDGTFGRHRWAIYGLGLPRKVLAKIYYKNALKIVPGLREQLKGILG